jgi:uncharacterized protein YfaS (alpha-2-macroglobulin family)
MRLGRLLFAALALFFSTVVPVAAQQAGSVSGRVTDAESGAGLAGASVQVVSGGGRVVAVGLTDQEGSYRLQNVPAGSYALVFMHVGYKTERLTDIRVTSGENTMAGTQLRPLPSS